MKRYWVWFKHLTKHRWYVMLECFKKGLILQGLLHDIDKYIPSQFFPYAQYHFNPDGSRIDRRGSTGHYDAFNTGNSAFEKSIYLHWRRSNHHWEAYVVPHNNGYKVFPMSEKVIKEMMCDWVGAGRVWNKDGKVNVNEWYSMNKDKLILHEDTRKTVEKMLSKF